MSRRNYDKKRPEFCRAAAIHQSGPCPVCKSYYRIFDNCNRCGTHAPEVATESGFSLAGRAPTGRRWSKALHRYLKADGT